MKPIDKIGSTTAKLTAATPLYAQVSERLMSKIRSRELTPKTKIPSIRKLSHELEVSEITVRRAVSEMVKTGALYTQPGVGVFVADGNAAAELNGSMLKLERAAVIGLDPIKEDDADSESSFVRMQVGIETQARALSVKTRFASLREIGRTGGLAAFLETHRIQGAVLFNMANHRTIGQIERLVPVVLLDSWFREATFDCIVVDNVPAAYGLTRHLIDLGHRRIAYFGTKRTDEATGEVVPDADSFERYTGYSLALHEAGILRDDCLVVHDIAQVKIKHALDAFFAMAEPPTAILCHGRSIAMGARGWLEKLGRAVPGDMSLAAFSSASDAQKGTSWLTCAAVDAERMGRMALKRLAERVAQDSPQGIKLSVSGKIVIGASTAPPKGGPQQT